MPKRFSWGEDQNLNIIWSILTIQRNERPAPDHLVLKFINLGIEHMSSLKHIAISGNIGSGKTTLAEKLSKHYNWTPLYESVDHNPYLKDFYSDMTRWAYHLQIYFLNSRFNQVHQIRSSSKTIIQDRTIYED